MFDSLLIRGGSVRDASGRMAMSSFLGNAAFSPGNYDDSFAPRPLNAHNCIKRTIPLDSGKSRKNRKKANGTESPSGEWPAIPSFLLQPPPPPPQLGPLAQTILQLPTQNPLQRPIALPLNLTGPLSSTLMQTALLQRQPSDRGQLQREVAGDREARSFWPTVVPSTANVTHANSNHPSYV